jgi:L-aminopeptidase/D-esterase-like protein
VKGIEVGHSQILSSKSLKGPGLATGVSVVFPQSKISKTFRVPAGAFSFNGNGEFSGLASIEEFGILEGPVGLCSTFSVGLVRDSLQKWMRKKYPHIRHENIFMGLPTVLETYDGNLHNVDSYALTEKHVFEALESASPKNLQRGSVGGGTGMRSFGFKSGIGSASLKFELLGQDATLGVMVQSNFGKREDLYLPGKDLSQKLPNFEKSKDGSLVVLIACDFLLSPLQLKRVAKRATLGMARTGSVGRVSSGDLFLAFCTKTPSCKKGKTTWEVPEDSELDIVLEATVEATYLAIMNSLYSCDDFVSGDRKIYSINSL